MIDQKKLKAKLKKLKEEGYTDNKQRLAIAFSMLKKKSP